MSNSLRTAALIVSILAIGLASQRAASAERTLRVHLQASGFNDGTSWHDAFVDFDDAIKLRETGDEIREAVDVAYLPSAPITASAMPPATGMYWTDPGLNAILRADLDGTGGTEILTGLYELRGIALDPFAIKMYFAEIGPTAQLDGTIRRANLDGTDVETLVTNLHVPRGVALDLVHGKVYWSNFGGGTKRIERANLDGSGREFVVAAECYSLALDVSGGKMYWPNISNTTGRKIQRANLDGTGVEDLVTTNVYAPSGIALDIANGHMYWTDQGTDAITRANMDGTGVQALVTTGLDRPFGIALQLQTGWMYWADWGKIPNIRRAALDGSNVEDLVTAGLDTPLYIELLPCTDIACDDADACTEDACVDGVCVNTEIVCDDGDPCTDNVCMDGVCQNTNVTCDDGDPCTDDACSDGVCEYTEIVCDDGDPCTDGFCQDGACQYVDNRTCTELYACTPGFWRQPHWQPLWPEGYMPSDDFDAAFGTDLFEPDITLEAAVRHRGGGLGKLARHATAALLNAASFHYPMTVQEVIAAVQSVDADLSLLSGVAQTFADHNESWDCPLGREDLREKDGAVIRAPASLRR